jgi:hypothetical protein
MLGAFDDPALPPPFAGPRWSEDATGAKIARHLVLQVFDALDEVVTVVEVGRAWVSEHGLLVIVEPGCVRLGFGIRSGLSRGARLDAAIAAANRTTVLGHVWLAEGCDDRHWSLIWGVVAPCVSWPRLALQRLVYSCARAAADGGLRARFASVGGDEYWTGMVEAAGGPVVPARVLWEQLA